MKRGHLFALFFKTLGIMAQKIHHVRVKNTEEFAVCPEDITWFDFIKKFGNKPKVYEQITGNKIPEKDSNASDKKSRKRAKKDTAK